MSIFHRVDQRRARLLGTPNEADGRLSLAQSAVVIAGLSALSWVVLIFIVVALFAVL